MATRNDKATTLPAVNPAKMTAEQIESMTNAQQLKPVALALLDQTKRLHALVEARNGEIAALGDMALFVRRDVAGKDMHAYRAEVTLSEKRKEIALIQKSPMVTAAGAIRLNQVANLQVLTPPSVVVDGRDQPNPHIERDDRTRAIKSVYIRRVAFGPSPTGNLVAVDSTLYFNVYTYFLQDLQAKLKKYPEAGTLGVRDNKPTSIKYQPKRWDRNANDGAGAYVNAGPEKTVQLKDLPMVFYPIEEPVGLWVDLSHPEIQAAFNEHVSRQKFGDRHARSICTRNVLLEHPAIANKVPILRDKAKDVTVPVYGWRHDYDIKEINRLGDKIAKGDVEDQNLQVIRTRAEASTEDLQAAAAGEGDEFGQVVDMEQPEEPEGDAGEAPFTEPEPPSGDPEPPAEQPQPEAKKDGRADMMAAILEGVSILGKAKYEQILAGDFPGQKLETMTPAALTILKRKVDTAVDSMNA
ncbi:MAG TPA: hypothetical protein VMU60_13690 [Syntrophobacteria bacterium]|jgi:hypothetical protein|nr:hypothetical protein [Syntrophobacteria bacterium]